MHAMMVAMKIKFLMNVMHLDFNEDDLLCFRPSMRSSSSFSLSMSYLYIDLHWVLGIWTA